MAMISLGLRHQYIPKDSFQRQKKDRFKVKSQSINIE